MAFPVANKQKHTGFHPSCNHYDSWMGRGVTPFLWRFPQSQMLQQFCYTFAVIKWRCVLCSFVILCICMSIFVCLPVLWHCWESDRKGIWLVTSCAGGRHNMPPPLQVDFWPFDLESGIQVTCDVGYPCANFSLPKPLCSRLRPDVRGRQASDAHHRLMPPP